MTTFTDDFTGLDGTLPVNFRVLPSANTSGLINSNKLRNKILTSASTNAKVEEFLNPYSVNGLETWTTSIEYDLVEYLTIGASPEVLTFGLNKATGYSSISIFASADDYPDVIIQIKSSVSGLSNSFISSAISGTLQISNNGGDLTYSVNGGWGGGGPITLLDELSDSTYDIQLKTTKTNQPIQYIVDFDNFSLDGVLIENTVELLSSIKYGFQLHATSENPNSVSLNIAIASALNFQATSINPDAVVLEQASVLALEIEAGLLGGTAELEQASVYALGLQASSINPDAISLESATIQALKLQASSINPDAISLESATIQALKLQASSINPNAVSLESAIIQALKLQASSINPDAVSLESANILGIELTGSNPGPYELEIANRLSLRLNSRQEIDDASLSIGLIFPVRLATATISYASLEIAVFPALQLSGYYIKQATFLYNQILALQLRAIKPLAGELRIGISNSSKYLAELAPIAKLSIRSDLALKIRGFKHTTVSFEVALIYSFSLTVECVSNCGDCEILPYSDIGIY